jgi:hypothetical protein
VGLLQLDATRYWNGTHLSMKNRIIRKELLSPYDMLTLAFCLHTCTSCGLDFSLQQAGELRIISERGWVKAYYSSNASEFQLLQMQEVTTLSWLIGCDI